MLTVAVPSESLNPLPGRAVATVVAIADPSNGYFEVVSADLRALAVNDPAALLSISIQLQDTLQACAAAEMELQESGRSLVHDLRAPMRQFASFVSVLEREQRDLSPRAQTYLSHIETSTVAALDKLDGFTDMLRQRRAASNAPRAD